MGDADSTSRPTDNAFLGLLKGGSLEVAYAGALSFMRRRYSRDLAGIDVGWRIRKAFGWRAEIADSLCEQGHFGQKTGKGFYVYEQGSRAGVPNPEVETLIAAASKRLGFQRRPIDKQEIIERVVFPMINEGGKILEEGMAYRPGDIDVVWVYGYGWPVGRGGPMFYGDQVGLAYVRDRLREGRGALGMADKELPAAIEAAEKLGGEQ